MAIQYRQNIAINIVKKDEFYSEMNTLEKLTS